MNDIQLYNFYLTLPTYDRFGKFRLYPKYVVLTGRSISRPHPHRYYSFDEFIDKLYEENSEFRTFLNKRIKETSSL